MTTHDPKHMQYLRSPRSELRSAEAEFRRRPKGMIERACDRVEKSQGGFSRLLFICFGLVISVLLGMIVLSEVVPFIRAVARLLVPQA